MKRILVFVLAMLLAMPLPALAQKRTLPRPYVTHVVTKEELIKACREEDRSILNVSCDQYLWDVNFALERMGFKGDDGKPFVLKDKEQFLEYLGNLSVEKAPKQQVVMGRVMPNSLGELGAFSRQPHEGEGCLYDGTNGGCVISLSCGNPYGTAVIVFRSSEEAGDDKKVGELQKLIDDAAKRSAELEAERKDAERKQREAERRLEDAIRRGAGDQAKLDHGKKSSRWDWINPTKPKGLVVDILGGAALVGLTLLVVKNVRGCAKATAGSAVAEACGW